MIYWGVCRGRFMDIVGLMTILTLVVVFNDYDHHHYDYYDDDSIKKIFGYASFRYNRLFSFRLF